MNGLRWAAAAGLLLASTGAAQQFSPHVGYAYPAGGRLGSSFEVTVGGQFLDGVNNAYISGQGVQVAIVEYIKPLSQGQVNKLRDELTELTQKKNAVTRTPRKKKAGEEEAAPAGPKPVWTDADEKRVEEIRAKMATFVRRPVAPQIVEAVRLRVDVAPNAALGERELRLATPLGMTNPLAFHIGQLPEFARKPAKPVDEFQAGKSSRFRNAFLKRDGDPDGPATVTLPAVINGQVMPGMVDHWRFPASKGQKLVIAVAARQLIPYISDAVPGWFQATVALYNSKGKEVQYSDHHRFHPEPVLYYEVEEDGEYTLAVKDSIYRGREDFVYRITAGELPFVASIFPLGGKQGVRASVEVKGWNLPAPSATPDTREKGVAAVTVRKGEQVSNSLPFAVDTLPERLEQEPNNQTKGQKSIKLPMIVNGRIDKPGDVDVFRLEGKAGEEIVAEVFARRLESPLDSILRLTDSSGKQIAVNDDQEDKASGLLTHHADSVLRIKLPKNGTYYLHLADTQHKGGPEWAYRLRMSHPQPDFELRVSPANINARPGMSVPVTVYAVRRDGFSGEIALKLKTAPEGFALNGGWIPAGQDKVRVTLTAPPSRIEKPRPVVLEGQAKIAGKDVRHAAVPAEDMMQAFFYRHLVPSKEWLVRVVGQGRTRGSWKVAAAGPVKLPTGGTVPVRLSIPSAQVQGAQLKFVLSEPPEGITIQKVAEGRDGLSLVLQADAKAKAGLKGNLIVDAFLERPSDGKQQANRRRQPLGCLPAIPFEVVGM